MSRALALLERRRLSGTKPVCVFVTLADVSEDRQWPECFPDIVVPASSAALRMDWRPVIGCKVVLIADQRTDILRKLAGKICTLAESVFVSVVQELQDGDPGFLWVRDKGWRKV